MKRHGLLLLNLGTPDAPETESVRTYLREFLSDPRVLDIPALQRALVLNLFILPFRPQRSAEAYRQIWWKEGSPLLVYGERLAERMARRLGESVHVELAMRYQNPSIADALDRFRSNGIDSIVVLPLFPQYSSSAWGSAVEKLFLEAGQLWNVPALQVIPPFYDHPGFLEAFASAARQVRDEMRPDFWLMSFHGLPERQVRKSDESGGLAGTHCLQNADCCESIGLANRNCYRAQCYATARGIAALAGIPPDSYQVTFQSRLGRDPWIRPYTDEVVPELAQAGVRRVAVLSPAFVADCLETLEELAMRARESFIDAGGEDLFLVPSLNDSDVWVDALTQIVRDGTVLGTLDLP